MEAGRELDAVVAEKVMGTTVEKDKFAKGINGILGLLSETDPVDYFVGGTNERIPFYSTDIDAAWQVVEKLDLLAVVALEKCNDGWRTFDYGLGFVEYSEATESAPLAICLAALKAVGYQAQSSGSL